MPESRTVNYGGAVNAALDRVLSEQPNALLFGEDVAIPGGVFGVTRGLKRTHRDRVFDTPISESAILGSALGSAMLGMRPIVEIMWADFALVALDQIVNQIANARYVSRGKVGAPLVVRTQQGSAPGACAQHSQSLEAFFLHTPGIRVAMPSTPQDAYDVLLSAAYSDDPVIVVENRTLYMGEKVSIATGGAPEPIGGSVRRREGADVTVVTWGAMTRRVEQSVDIAAESGVTADVIELRWLNPLDIDSVVESVRRTGRLLVVHEANVTGGFGAEIIAQVLEHGIPLDAPPARLGARDARIPAAPALADAVLPQPADILSAIMRISSRFA